MISFLVTLALVILGIYYLLPFVIVYTLRLLLRRMQFRATQNGIRSFSQVMFRIPLKMNFQLIVKVDELHFRFYLLRKVQDWLGFKSSDAQSFMQVEVNRLQLFLLIRDDFEKWSSSSSQIELLKLINITSDKMRRNGTLDMPTFNQIVDTARNQMGPNHASDTIKANEYEFLRNLVAKMQLLATDSSLDFCVYSMSHLPEDRQTIDEQDIQGFYRDCLQTEEFRTKFLLSRVFAPSLTVNLHFRPDDQELEVRLQSPLLQLLSPTQVSKQGAVINAEICIIAPMDRKLAQNFCNYEVRINLEDGVLKVNKRFLKNFIKFFVYLDTLFTVIKAIRKLVLIQNFQDVLLAEQLNGSQAEIVYRNHKDSAIPKRLQVVIQRSFQIVMTDRCKSLAPFLQNTSQVIHVNIPGKSSFEMARTLKDSYYINFQTEKIEVRCNNKPSLQITNLSQDLDFVFLKEVNNLPIKKSRFHITNSVTLKVLTGQVDSSLLRGLLEVANFYKEGLWTASVKHKISGQLRNKDFLQRKIIASNSQRGQRNELILKLYEPGKHIDTVINSVNIDQVDLQKNKLYFQMTDLAFSLTKQNGIEKTKLTFSSIKVGKKDFLPLLQIANCVHQKLLVLPTSNFAPSLANKDLEEQKVWFWRTVADKAQVNVDLSVVLDSTQDILYYSLIAKHYTKKWATRYHFRRPDFQDYPQTTVCNQVMLGKATLIWNLSSARLLCLVMEEFRPEGFPQQTPPTCVDMQELAVNLARRGNFWKANQKTKFTQVCYKGALIHRYAKNATDEVIIDGKNLQLQAQLNPEKRQFDLSFERIEWRMPEHFKFGGAINEMIKQGQHTTKWFRHKYAELKKHNDFSYRWKVLVPKKKSQPAAFIFSLSVQKGEITFEEHWLKQVVMLHNEVAEKLEERGIFRGNPKVVHNWAKKLKIANAFDKYLQFEIVGFVFSYSIPVLESAAAFQRVLDLDEAETLVRQDFFHKLNPSTVCLHFDYWQWNARNFFKPVFQFWNFDMKLENIIGELKPDACPTLFAVPVCQRIFNRFPLLDSFNRLPTKWYYDLQINMDKSRMSFQGIQTWIFFHDFFAHVSRLFVFDDISSSKDPKKTKLPYFVGLDKLRNKNHSQILITSKQCEIEVYPRRILNRFQDRLLLTFSDSKYQKTAEFNDRQQEIANFGHYCCLRNFIICKDPIKQQESALLHLPIIELRIRTNYNRDRSQNHFSHMFAKSEAEYLSLLSDFLTQDFYFDLKLNVPSFGKINRTKSTALYLPQLLKAYVEQSPVPVAHYQRSHMKFLDELLSEYVRRGQSVTNFLKRLSRMNSPKPHFSRQSKDETYCIKATAFLSDLIFLFTDFDDQDWNETIDNQVIEPEQINNDALRDAYLKRYYGLCFSTENLRIKTTINSRRGEYRSFEITNSEFKNNFLRLAYLNSDCLFHIRHPNFEQLRRNQWPEIMDNYSYFCKFFEQPEYENIRLLNNFKTLFPDEVLVNEFIQHQIVQAQGGYNDFDPSEAMPQRQNSLFCAQDETGDAGLDFVFKENSTIGIVYLIQYEQHKKLDHSFFEQKDKKVSDFSMMRPVDHEENKEDHDVTCRHYLQVEFVRFLTTSHIHEQLFHHLVKGFQFHRFRKTDFIDVEKDRLRKQDFLSVYNQIRSDQKMPKLERKHSSPLGGKHQQKKEIFFAFKLIDPQISLQNDLSKSQVLIQSNEPIIATICAHSFMQRHSALQLTGPSQLLMPGAFKYELTINAKTLNLYVAPTYINLESPTFWITPQKSKNYSSCKEHVALETELEEFFHEAVGDNDSQSPGISHQEEVPTFEKTWESSSQVLRKIASLSNSKINLEFLNAQLVGPTNPQLAIDLSLGDGTCSLDGPSMWHFLNVFNGMILSRGEKSAELQFLEETRTRQLSNIKLDELRKLIDKEVRELMGRMFCLSVGENGKPISGRQVSFSVDFFKFNLFNLNKLFAAGLIESCTGIHMIYMNRESKTDIDISRISLFNHWDKEEEFRSVIVPSDTQKNGETMIKFRVRDKYVVVKTNDENGQTKAPWRVYDQFEVFIYPTSICLTKNFYRQLKVFFFDSNPLMASQRQVAPSKKLELMVPTKVIQKQLHKLHVEIDSKIDKSSSHSMASNEHQHIEVVKLREAPEPVLEFPAFFRYMRMNEIQMSIKYFHGKNSLLNIKNLQLKMSPFILHGSFATIRKTLERYEKYCKGNFIKQIPNLFRQKTIKMKEKVKEVVDTEHGETEDVSGLVTNEEIKLAYSRKLLLGDFAN